ncbi:MAG: metal ABC transporter substrate-binding protein [Candidatus Micrarchaeota archaeon]|nr:metal ABC transporter substrate-binding protein [Candidatus Micrarchaeota archaeon]
MARGLLPILVLSLCSFMLAGCMQAEKAEPNGKLKVVASFYPLYDFARNVGGERAEVTVLIPPGVEPHNFEPTPSAIKQLSVADVFILNGAGIEPWADNLINGVGNNELVVVDTSKGIELIRADGQNENEAHEGERGHGEYDPHIWLAPAYAKKQVQAIKDAFIQADPEGKDYYERNAAAYEAKLDALDAKIRTVISSCRKKDILITHATLGYFCGEYGCNQIPIEGVSEEGEPSPAELVKIVEQARAQNVTAVFFESLISPKSAQAIASEINGQVLMFNTIHGLTSGEQARSEDYVSLMEENLDSIRTGLECG